MNIFIDNDLEEQYGEQKYKEYLEKENKQMLQDIATMNDEIKRLHKELEKLQLELDSTNSTLKKYANKLIRVAHLHNHYVEYDYREFDNLLEEVLYNE